MREILFRGKSERSGEWVYGSLIVTHGGCVIYSKYHPLVTADPEKKGDYLNQYVVDPRTVGQFTGLTDKNGKEIFEGDIANAYNEINGCIKFGKYKCPYEGGTHLGFYVEWENKHGYSSMRKDLGYWKDKIEVIGNIRDNPELLEVRE